MISSFRSRCPLIGVTLRGMGGHRALVEVTYGSLTQQRVPASRSGGLNDDGNQHGSMNPASHHVGIRTRGVGEGAEHLVPQAGVEVDSIRCALENEFRWFTRRERGGG